MRLVLSMGLKPGGRSHEPLQPVLREVDMDRGPLRDLAWRDPRGAGRDDQLGHPHLEGDRLVQPGRTSVLTISLTDWRIVDTWSHRWLCDVHSVSPRVGGGWLVTSTGIEAVLEVVDGEVVARHDLRDPLPDEDYRLRPHDFARPHASHPAYAFDEGGLWVTEMAAQRCRRLGDGASVAFPEGPVHDGVLREGLRWFTTVTGHVVAIDPETLERRVHLDLGQLADTRRRLGWCRGIDVVGDRCWVGMTMLRRSAWREMARWAVQGEAGRKLPTRIVELDWRRGRLLRELEVGNAAGGVVYGVTAMG